MIHIPPWDICKPDGPQSGCVVMVNGQKYAWDDTNCDFTGQLFCENCDSMINKYVLLDDGFGRNWSEAQDNCYNEFGTSLASIHSD